MAGERNVITILIQAIDRASSVLAKHRREIADLEREENKLAAATTGSNEQLAMQVDTSREAGRATKDLHTNVTDLRRETTQYNRELDHTVATQQTFFDNLSRGGKIIDEQNRALRDLSGRSLPSVRSRGGAFRAAGFAGIAAGDEQDVDRVTTALEGQLSIFDEMRTSIDENRHSFRAFANEVSDVRVTRAIRAAISGLPGGGREGEVRGGALDALLGGEVARLQRAAARAFTPEDRRELDRQLNLLTRFRGEARGLAFSLEELQHLGKAFDIPSFEGLPQRFVQVERSARRLGDLAGDNGALGRFRAILSGLGTDLDRRLTPGFVRASSHAERIGRVFGNSGRDVDRFAASLQRSSKNLLDVTRFDDTVQIGLRRLTRLLVIVGAFVPFIVAGFGTLVGAVTALVGGVTALVGAFSQLAGVAATLPAIFAATIGAFAAFQAVVGPGITNITTRFKEARQVQESARKQSTENARAEQQAQESLARTRQQNAEQIADQERQIGQTRRNNAEQERDAERNLIQLKRRNAEEEADLVRDLRRAKRDAAADAAQREREYQALVKQNRADEREIAQELSVRRAQLGALRLQGADPAQIRAAEAGVAASERELSREQTQNRNQEAKQRSDNAKARRNDVQQIADLERRIARTRRDNNEQEAEAERNLFRMKRNNAEQLAQQEQQLMRTRRDAAEQEAQAAAQLAETQRKASADLTDTLKGLEPAEKRIVTQLLRIRQEWLNLTRATRTSALNFGADALTFIEQHLPAIAARANQFTNAIVGLGREAFARFTTPEVIGRVNRILDDGLRLTKQFGGAVMDVADAFLILADRASPVTRHLGDIVARMGESIRKTTAESERTGGLDEFFARTNRVLDKTLAILGNLGRALLNVLKIGEPFGEILLGDLVRWSERVQRFTEDQVPAIESFFRDSVPVVEELGGLLSDLVVQLFRIGRELIRPDEQGNVFLIDIIKQIREGLPGFADFIIELTEKSGPKLLKFLTSLGKFVGLLVGPEGAFIKLLDVLTFIFNLIDSLPAPIAQLGVAFIAFGGIVTSVGTQIRKLFALLSVQSRAGGTVTTASVIRGLRGTAFGLLIAALIIFPGLLDPVVSGIRLLSRTINTLLEPFDKLGQALGFGDESGSKFIKTLFALDIALRVFAGTSMLRILGNLRAFIQLIRESQRITIFGRILDALSAAFPVAAKAIEAAIDALRAYIARVRAARAENRLYQSSNIANAFTSMLQPIGAAIQALVTYIQQVRAARRANQLLAISNAQVGFSNLAAGFSGLGGLAGSIRGLGGLIPVMVRLLPLSIRVAGGIGLIVTAAIGLNRALREAGAPAWFRALISPLLELPTVGRAFHIWARGVQEDLRSVGHAFDGLKEKVQDFFAKLPLPGRPGFVERASHAGAGLGERIRGFFGIDEGDVNRLERDVRRTTAGLARMGQSIVRNFNGVKVSLDTAARGLTRSSRTTVDVMKQGLARFNADVRSLMDSLDTLQSSLDDFIRARIEATPLPAQAALDRLDRQETLRDRAQRRRQANDDLAEAKRQQRLQEQSLSSAIARLARLRARLAGGGRVARTAGGRDVFVSAEPLTPQQRAATRQAIREQERIVAERRRELQEARQHTREVGEARLEVLHQIAVEEKRDALQADLERQQAQREKEIQAAQKRANDALGAYIKALDQGKIPLAKAQARLIAVLEKLGISPAMTRAWMRTGAQAAEDFGTGFAGAVFDVTTKIRELIKKGHFQAEGVPVIVVTNAVTLRRLVVTAEPAPIRGEQHDRPHAAGGRVYGREGAAVPILAHAGEWVLNRSQQSKMAMMAGLDRSLLERSLFYKLETRQPKLGFALGGIVQPTGTTHGETTFLTPINIQTSSPTVDAEYLSRALESRIRQVI